MKFDLSQKITSLMANFSVKFSTQDGLKIFSPIDGSQLGVITEDYIDTINQKLKESVNAQKTWCNLSLSQRAEFLTSFINKVEQNKTHLAEIITIDAGKTLDESTAEINGFITTFKDMIKLALNRAEAEAKLHQEYSNNKNVLRKKILVPYGVGDITTSYNFPLAVFSWSAAPMLLTGNTVIWKPSEKVPLVALAIEKLCDNKILQVVIGGKNVGEELLKHDDIKLLNATGSVQMCEAMKQIWATKTGSVAKPVLEGGGNNGVIVSEKNLPEYIEKAVDALTASALAGGGQKCTDTRRIFVHEKVYEFFLQLLQNKIKSFIDAGNVKSPLDGKSSLYGYAPLIDKFAYDNLISTRKQAEVEGGKYLFGERVINEFPNAFYLNPTIMLMPNQTPIMFQECFGPLLYIIKYTKFEDAIKMAIAPENAGLVNGLYSQDKKEIGDFEVANSYNAGHTVINMPTGTSIPANRLGFTGKRQSGSGITLDWEGDPFAHYFDDSATARIVINTAVPIS